MSISYHIIIVLTCLGWGISASFAPIRALWHKIAYGTFIWCSFWVFMCLAEDQDVKMCLISCCGSHGTSALSSKTQRQVNVGLYAPFQEKHAELPQVFIFPRDFACALDNYAQETNSQAFLPQSVTQFPTLFYNTVY